MTIRLEGKRVLVSGGTRGIGRSIVTELARAGADVVTCYRQDEESAQSLLRELKTTAGNHHVIRADVSQPADVVRMVEDCGQRLGSLDALVHSAGTISHIPLEELDLEEWRRIIDTNLTSAYLLVQQALPWLRDGSSVVNVGSRAATAGVPQRAHYTAAKAGLTGLTRSLAKELGARNIRVNVVAAGPVETGMAVPEERLRRYRESIALRRLGEPHEIASVVSFLISDLATFLTGETINVDGGI